MAQRQGLQLVKTRRRDPRALDFGRFWLTTTPPSGSPINARRIVLGWEGPGLGATLDEVERYLTGGTRDGSPV